MCSSGFNSFHTFQEKSCFWHSNYEHIIETGSEIHICFLSQLDIALATRF